MSYVAHLSCRHSVSESLFLYISTLEGEIPDSLYILPNLKQLMLHSNVPGFDGTLKTDIGNLTKLTHLDISDNPLLTGTLPSELGLCTELEFLHLDNTAIYGSVPQEG